MIISLKNKNAVVCGSSQGIGKAIAMQFAESGASVYLIARDEHKLNETMKQLKKSGNQMHSFINCDFSEPDKALEKISNALENIRIDILINNTGGPNGGQLKNAATDELVNAFKMHIVMSQYLTKLIIPGMIKSEWGRIINIISVSAKQPIDNLGVSNTIRGAMVNWGKTLANELGGYGITVNNVLPGQTETERIIELITFNAKSKNKSEMDIKDEMLKNIPAGRFAKPEEIAYAVTFLASDMASFINGINLPVDGGYLKSL